MLISCKFIENTQVIDKYKYNGGVYMAFIELKNISRIYKTRYSKVTALDNINLQVDKGDFLAIAGQSGSGKSTLMNILGCLDLATSGKYFLDNTNISSLNENQLSYIRNKQIGFVFQSFNLISHLTAIENVELPLIYRKINKKNRRDIAEQALENVGLSNRKNHKPYELSGGQQQRVAIARAIALSPPIILADEPTGNLDSSSSNEIISMLNSLNENGTTIILITHDNNIANNCKRKIIISDGKIKN